MRLVMGRLRCKKADDEHEKGHAEAQVEVQVVVATGVEEDGEDEDQDTFGRGSVNDVDVRFEPGAVAFDQQEEQANEDVLEGVHVFEDGELVFRVQGHHG